MGRDGRVTRLVPPVGAPTVLSYYADGLAAKGWSTEIRNMPDGSAVFADKGARTAAVMVTESRRGSEVRVLLGNQ